MKVTRTYFWTDNQQRNAGYDLEKLVEECTLDEYINSRSATNESDIVDSFADMLRHMTETEVNTCKRYYGRRDGKQLHQTFIDDWLKVSQDTQKEYDALYRGIPNREKENIMSLIKGIYIDKAEDRIAKIKNSKKYKESDNEDFKAKLLEKAGTYNRVTVAFKDGRVGTADCDPQDTFDPFVGFCIATCKALAGTAGDLYRLYNSKLNK